MNRYESTFLSRDLIAERERYFYSFVDHETLSDFRACRSAFRATLQRRLSHEQQTVSRYSDEATQPRPMLRDLTTTDTETLLRRFCASKRVWTQYTADWRATPVARFDDLDAYIWLAEVFAAVVLTTRDLRFVNALLQIHDIIQSRADHLKNGQYSALLETLNTEAEAIKFLAQHRATQYRNSCE